MEYLAIDFSKTRMGFAYNYGALVFGKGSINRRRLPIDLKHIAKLSKELETKQIVIGLPLRTDMQLSSAADRVKSFAKILEEQGYLVFFQDERFSTKRAIKIDQNKQGKQTLDIDELSAIEILSLFLEKQKNLN